MDYLKMTLVELHECLVRKEVTPLELVKKALKKLHANKDNAVEAFNDEEALKEAALLTEPEVDNLFWGVPVCVKDNIATKGLLTTASSEILKDYVPVFDATVVKKLKEAKAIIIAKTTLDELAMGGTGMSGHKGYTYNPWDPSHKKQVGGSSAGSATVVSAGIVPFALGSDTGDSIRKPASYAGLVGMKPTWSRISRFGLFPFATSMDHVGYFTRSVEDAAIALNLLAGRDVNDSTSSTQPVDDYTRLLNTSIEGKRIAVIDEIVNCISNKTIVNAFNESLKTLEKLGAIINHVSVDNNVLKTILPTYMIISNCEATSNNACLDGIKYGPRHGGNSYEEIIVDIFTAPVVDSKSSATSNVINKRVLDHGMGYFQDLLPHMATKYNCKMKLAPPDTTRTCSSCGFVNERLELKDNYLICKDCGVIIQRDENASINCYNSK